MRFSKSLTFLILATGLTFALPAGAEQKPFTRDQVQGMVRDGLGDESGAKLIEQRGIDFAPVEDFLQGLKAAGASEVFLNALRAAQQPGPGSAKKPLNQVQIFVLLAGQVPSHRMAMLVEERGIDFEPQQEYLDEVRLGGGEDELIEALKRATVTKPSTVDPAAQARQAEVQQHAARGAELFQENQYADPDGGGYALRWWTPCKRRARVWTPTLQEFGHPPPHRISWSQSTGKTPVVRETPPHLHGKIPWIRQSNRLQRPLGNIGLLRDGRRIPLVARQDGHPDAPRKLGVVGIQPFRSKPAYDLTR